MLDFTQLLATSAEQLQSLAAQSITLPPQFASVERQEKSGKLTLHNHFLTIPERGEWRGVHIHSPKINIITQFFYPEPRWQLPIYAMEFVVLGVKPIVGVIDAKCMLPTMNCAATVKTVLNQAHAEFPDLSQADDAPEWFLACRSGDDFFVRPQDQAQLDALGQAHLQVWQALVALLKQPQICTDSDTHQQHSQAYKDHHRINSPGLRLMNRSFGAEWTDTYMRGYLFR